MKLQVMVALSLALASAAEAASIGSHLIKESINLPRGWERRSVASDDAIVPLRIAIRQNAVGKLEERLSETSDPAHERYGAHLTREEVNSYLAPAPASAEAVRRWLEENGVADKEDLSRRSMAGDWITANVPVWKARDMLKADFAIFEHKRSGEQRLGALSYSLPRDLHEHVDFVGPMTLAFLEPKANRAPFRMMGETDIEPSAQRVSADAAGSTPPGCDTRAVTSECLRRLYGTINYTVKDKSKRFFIGISGFLEQYAIYSDLKQFLTDQRPEAAAADYKFDVTSINGGLNDQTVPGVEANLDVQTVAGISYPIPFTYYTTAGRPPILFDLNTPTNTNEPYEKELSFLLAQDKLPTVLSTSYGDDEQTVPRDYATRVCTQIMALGARGVSLLYSSGDNGVGADGKCFSNGNEAKNGTAKFLPAFPASCPYSTTIGGTEAFSPEVAVSENIGGFYAGGGFSDYFKAPKYQDKVVKAYVKSLGKQYAGLYNKQGRGYPDVAAQASRYSIVVGGKKVLVGGTSASAPTFASIVALLNDARLAAGKPTLGFLNPLIYSKLLGSSGLTDILSGSSAGCNTTGFPAQTGWDAVTGAGTPVFPELLKLTA